MGTESKASFRYCADFCSCFAAALLLLCCDCSFLTYALHCSVRFILYTCSPLFPLFQVKANACGLRVMVDFVPNHVARDHWWTTERPWMCVQGSDVDAAAHPDRFFRVQLARPQPMSTPSSSSAAAVAAGGGDGSVATVPIPTGGKGGEGEGESGKGGGPTVWLAHGRDPHSGGWNDTVQLNYRHPELRQAMKAILLR